MAVDTWTTKAAMPTGLYYPAAGAIGTKLYVAGGYGSGPSDTLYEYDSTTDTWATKAAMPASRYYHVAAVIGTKLYVAGGAGANTLYEYDSTTDTWATKAAMPATRRYAAAGVIGTKLYVAGGEGANTLYEYDQTTDTWATKAAMPATRTYAAAGVIGTKLYVAGGEGANTLYEYDSTTDTWATKAAMPATRAYAAAGVIGTKLYVAGGSSTNTLYEYDQTTDTWATKATLPASLSYHAAAAIGSKLYVAGGYTGAASSALYEYQGEAVAEPVDLNFTGSGTLSMAAKPRLSITPNFTGSGSLSMAVTTRAGFATTGTRISPPLSLSAIQSADSSSIVWDADTPASTGVTVETSIDGGTTWQTATSGATIPGITVGDNLLGKSLLTRITLTGDATGTPEVHSLSVSVNQSELSHHVTESVPDTQRFNLGVYVLTTPVSTGGETPATHSATGYDKLHLLQHGVGDSYWIAAGTGYLYAAAQVIADAGVTGLPPIFDSAAQAKTLDTPMVWADPTAHTWLEIVNDILKGLGYGGLYVDGDGRFRAGPLAIPTTQAPLWTFNTDDENTTIVEADWSYSLDVFEQYNWWRFVREGMTYSFYIPGPEEGDPPVLITLPDQPVEGAGLYTVDHSGGGYKRRKVVTLTAADQDALVALGDKQVADDEGSSRELTFTTGPFPILSHGDVVLFRDATLGLLKLEVISYSMPLDGDGVQIIGRAV